MSEPPLIPLVDMHCHLLAGLDDGPRTEEEAVEMCRVAYADGIRAVAAGAHQNERWQAVTPERIRRATQALDGRLREADIPLTVFACAEVMVRPDLEAAWRRRELLSVADLGRYLLVEMPHDLCVDLGEMIPTLRDAGVRPILAHPERCGELLHEPGRIEGWIRAGCLVQVSASSVTHPRAREDERALKSWVKRGVIHCLGSDGHSAGRRPPRMAEAYRRLVRWAGAAVADRLCSTNGLVLSQGLPLRVPDPLPEPRRWFSRFW